jgi:hypothetical protein
MQMPKMNCLMSKQDVEFIDYDERLRQCIVFDLADEDWDWFKLIMNDYVVNGHLKHVVSCQASILELPRCPQSDFMTVQFLKSIKLQMSYAHYFGTINCNGVQSLDYMVCVEGEPGKVRPYENTNLQWEVLPMRFPQLKPEYWYWATHLLMGLIWYSWALPGDNCIFCIKTLMSMSSLCLTLMNISAPTSTSISAKKSTSHAGVAKQSLLPGLMPRGDFGQWTLNGTWSRTAPPPLKCLPHQAYAQDMAKLGLVDIAPELLQEMSDCS